MLKPELPPMGEKRCKKKQLKQGEWYQKQNVEFIHFERWEKMMRGVSSSPRGLSSIACSAI
jgi:hypothetical protein